MSHYKYRPCKNCWNKWTYLLTARCKQSSLRCRQVGCCRFQFFFSTLHIMLILGVFTASSNFLGRVMKAIRPEAASARVPEWPNLWLGLLSEVDFKSPHKTIIYVIHKYIVLNLGVTLCSLILYILEVICDTELWYLYCRYF